MPNIPYRYTPDAECERQWQRKKTEKGNNNFTTSKGNKNSYDKNYDDIDWKKK